MANYTGSGRIKINGSSLYRVTNYTGSGKIRIFGSSLYSTTYYAASGKIHFFGCGLYRKKLNVYYKWAEGSILFSKQKAMKGRLEEIYIKTVLLNRSYNQIIPIYKDSYNSLWNEEDLVEESDAISLIQDFIDLERDKITQYLNNC